MRIVILGAPGAGKGTQAKLLESKYAVKHLAAGDLIREEIAKRTRIGKQLESFVNKGKLAPDKIVIKIMRSAIAKYKNFVVDGFPRNLEQAKAFDRFFDIDLAIDIEIDDDIAIERLSKRRICPKCNAIFHLETNPPKHDNVCNFCNSELAQRSDDREEVVKERLEVYKRKTIPLIDYYRSKGKLRVVNGNKSIEEVSKEVKKVICTAIK
ncbi:MAG: nucleoside monophosphate kinase [Candidatus Thermoplasmatota archaeon]